MARMSKVLGRYRALVAEQRDHVISELRLAPPFMAGGPCPPTLVERNLDMVSVFSLRYASWLKRLDVIPT